MRSILYHLILFSLIAGVMSCSRGDGGRCAFTVRLINGNTREPVADADVSWWFADMDLITGALSYHDEQLAFSDAEGECCFQEVNPDRLGRPEYVLIEAEAPGFAETYHLDSLTFMEDGSPILVLGLLPQWGEARVEGVIRRASDLAPLAGSRIRVTARRRPDGPAAASDDPRFVEEKVYEGTGGADGSYAVSVDYFALDRVSYLLDVVAEKEGHAYARFDMGASRSEKDSLTTVNYAAVSCRFYLSDESRNVAVEGELRDAEGRPVAHSEVILSAINYMETTFRGGFGGKPQSARIYPLVTDGEGRFSQEVGAPYVYGLRNGLRVAYEEEPLYWRTPLEVGMSEARNVLVFRDGTTAGLRVTLIPEIPAP